MATALGVEEQHALDRLCSEAGESDDAVAVRLGVPAALVESLAYCGRAPAEGVVAMTAALRALPDFDELADGVYDD